ncbi:hypothetical protein [Burkholderia sp. SCN-KJ]|uniref:hypothetical protein n=1 Tax=Burkholderia sp. SCN-KJ TaxID=2969248 RepID=UPI0021502451|nr:hypothetical protein [Burkholderia sp. SCN-KJ]MCR4468201.1 hypothetical protein [Burkholderia sp. SCN-KJ]
MAAAVTLPCVGREAAVHERRDRPSPAQGGAVKVLRRLTTFPDTHGEPLRGHLAAPGRPPARSRRPGSPPLASACAHAAAGLAVTGMRFAADPGRGGRA